MLGQYLCEWLYVAGTIFNLAFFHSIYESFHDRFVNYVQGFSLVPVHHKDKVFLVAFGGSRKESSNQVGEQIWARMMDAEDPLRSLGCSNFSFLKKISGRNTDNSEG